MDKWSLGEQAIGSKASFKASTVLVFPGNISGPKSPIHPVSHSFPSSLSYLPLVSHAHTCNRDTGSEKSSWLDEERSGDMIVQEMLMLHRKSILVEGSCVA